MAPSVKPNKSMLTRILVVMLTLVIFTVSITGFRLVWLMVVEGEKYQSKAAEQQLYDTMISAPRGDIFDSEGNVLATSAPAWNVYITPNGIVRISDDTKREKIRTAIADGLSEILGEDRETIYKNTIKSLYYVTVKKKIDKEQADKVRKFLVDNSDLGLSSYIGLDETTKRYYPNDTLASVILGFVGVDNQGLSGVESYYDTELTGIAGRVVAAKNAHGTDMPFTYEKVEEAKKGNSLGLTVNSYIQYVCEKYIAEAVDTNKVAQRGAVIAMNPKTGAILAMAIKGDFNPNDPFTLDEINKQKLEGLEGDERDKMVSNLLNLQWRNKLVSDTYEPGSVFKVITAAIALEENLTKPTANYNCGGSINIAGQTYHCHKRGGHGAQTLVDAMENSCNPVFITLGQLIGTNTFSKYFEAFGLTQKTGVDLPGESSSVYHKNENMGPTELSSTSFGQTFKVTPIQLITAISAAVNGGNLIQPHIVEKITDTDGNVVKSIGTTVKRQVISQNTSVTIRTLMEQVVKEGGGKNGYVAGFSVGGKTGTSEKVAEMIATGQSGLYISSYCTVAPANDPEIAILVLLDEPHGDAYYGGTICAPVGAQILGDVLPYLGYEPKYTDAELGRLAVNVPAIIGKTVQEAKTELTSKGLTYKVVGNGEKVVSQLPDTSHSLYNGGVVVIYTEEKTEKTKATVPNLLDLTLSAAKTVAAQANINIQFSGNTHDTSVSVSYRQSIEAGTSVDAGTVVTVYFRDNNTGDIA